MKPKHKIVFHKDYHPKFPTVRDVKVMQKSRPQGNVRLHSRVKPFGDVDRDGTPNFIDCYPRNPLKHAVTIKTPSGKTYDVGRGVKRAAIGAGRLAKKGVEKVVKMYEEYPEKAKQRRQKKIERLAMETKKYKEEIALERARIGLEKARMEKAKMQKARGGLGYGLGDFAGIGERYFEKAPSYFEKPKVARKRKVKRKKK